MALAKLLENPAVFGLSQKLNPFTVSLYAELARSNIPSGPEENLLDIGCGLGVHRELFKTSRYTGIDVNPDYVARARRMHGNSFLVMDAAHLQFENESFSQALSIATCHHLDDSTVRAMIRQVLRVVKADGALHIIDPVLPVSRAALIRKLIFSGDRGRCQRTLEQMSNLLGSAARIAKVDLRRGLLHDVCYFRLTR